MKIKGKVINMKIKGSKEDFFFDIFNYILMTTILFITLYPFWYILVVSFNEGSDAARGGIYFFPRIFSLNNYKAVFQNTTLIDAFIITIAKTILGTTLHVLFTGIIAFAMGHKDLIGRRFYMMFGAVTMFFSGGLIPYYLLIRDLHMRNTIWVYIIPAMFSFWDMIIMMTFFKELPSELSESAKIDGAEELRIFWSVILPLSMPILATMALFNGVGQWNDFFTGVIFIDKQKLLPIQTVLYKIVAENTASTMLMQVNLPDKIAQRKITSESIKLATMVVTTVPIICVYPFLQKYFVKGMLIGSIKG